MFIYISFLKPKLNNCVHFQFSFIAQFGSCVITTVSGHTVPRQRLHMHRKVHCYGDIFTFETNKKLQFHSVLKFCFADHLLVNTEGNGQVTHVHNHNLTLQYEAELVFITKNCNSSTITFYNISNDFIFNISFNYFHFCHIDLATNTNNSYSIGNETEPM